MSGLKRTDIEKTASTLYDLIKSGVKTKFGSLILKKLNRNIRVKLVAPQLIDLVASRYLTTNKIINEFIIQGHCPNIIELGAGFSPHSIEFSDKVNVYIEVDLPINSKMKRKIIKEISPSDKTIFIGIDAFSKEAWKEINKKINRDQPTIIFGEGFFQYTSKKQRRLLAKKILPILNNGCLFFEDSIRYHPEFVLNRKIESGIKKVVKQSKSSNYLEKLSQKELTQELKSYGFNVKRISPIFIRTKNPFFKNFRTWVLTRKCNSAN